MAPVAIAPERILQITTKPSFQTVWKYSGIETQERKPVGTFKHELAINGETHPPNHPEHAMTHWFLASPKLRATLREIVRENAERFYASQMQPALTQAAKKSFFGHNPNRFWIAQRHFENNCFVFIEHMSTEMAHNRGLGYLFARSIERWTQFTMFMNTFMDQVWVFFQFGRPVRSLFVKNLKGQAKLVHRVKHSLESPFLFLLTNSNISKSSGDDKYRKHTENKHTKCTKTDYAQLKLKERKDCKQRRRNFFHR